MRLDHWARGVQTLQREGGRGGEGRGAREGGWGTGEEERRCIDTLL